MFWCCIYIYMSFLPDSAAHFRTRSPRTGTGTPVGSPPCLTRNRLFLNKSRALRSLGRRRSSSMVLARPTWEAAFGWFMSLESDESVVSPPLLSKPKPLSPPSSRCKPLEARSWCSCRVHRGNASWLDAVFSMSVLMSVSSSLQLDIVHRRFSQGTQRGSFGDQKVATRGTSKTLSRRMWRPLAWCSETKEELFRRPNCRRRKAGIEAERPASFAVFQYAMKSMGLRWTHWVWQHQPPWHPEAPPAWYFNRGLLVAIRQVWSLPFFQICEMLAAKFWHANMKKKGNTVRNTCVETPAFACCMQEFVDVATCR